MHSVSVVYDVRSQPYSKHNPQFNRPSLELALALSDVDYGFLGEVLGARSRDASDYVNNRVNYAALAARNEFQEGLATLREAAKRSRIALLCAERDPIVCHRAILIARHLRSDEIEIQHIHADGTLESTPLFEGRLLRLLGLPEQDLFNTREQQIERAYDIQGEKIAYAREPV
jgi:uncharacterized protein (DUF488 family)